MSEIKGQRNDFMRTLEEMDTNLDLEALKKQQYEEESRTSKKKKTTEDSVLVYLIVFNLSL
jgi:hypothetical protein